MTRTLKIATLLIAAVVLAALSASTLTTSAPTASRAAAVSPRFLVEVDGVPLQGVRSVSGLAAETEVLEYNDGSSPMARKIPGLTKVPDVTIKRGIMRDTALWDWYEASMRGQAAPRDVTLTLLDAQGDVIVRYHLVNAWPSKYSAGPFDASGNEVAVETVELAHEGLTIEDGDEDD